MRVVFLAVISAWLAFRTTEATSNFMETGDCQVSAEPLQLTKVNATVDLTCTLSMYGIKSIFYL